MNNVVAVNPFRCRVWRLHPRLDELLTEESCKDEIESFVEHGQLVPALGRRLPRGGDHDVELIYGARRLFVARLLNKPLQVEVREVSDRDGLIAMDIENRHRTDISAYERGCCYARWLEEGLFQSQGEIAAALQVSASQVSRLLRLARLPIEVVAAFNSTTDLCEGWGVDLSSAAEKESGRRALVSAAQTISAFEPRPQPREIYKRLKSAALDNSACESHAIQEQLVRDSNDIPLFRIRHQRDAVVVLLPLERLSASALEAAERATSALISESRGWSRAAPAAQLHAANAQVTDRYNV